MFKRLSSITELAKKHGIFPLRRFSQNFLFDKNLCNKIVKVGNLHSDYETLEIGPGIAGLTVAVFIANPSMNLTVIEIDKRCIPLLEEVKSFYPNLNIIQGDVLKINLSDLIHNKNKKINIISNLPYNIGTEVLTSLLFQSKKINRMTLMLQKELVDRIVSKPNTKTYGRLSIICQIVCNIRKYFDVNPEAFYPKPKIWSSVINLEPKKDILSLKLLKKIEKITNTAFSFRRKTLKSSLKTLDPNINSILKNLSLRDSLRPENLSPDDYLALAQEIIEN